MRITVQIDDSYAQKIKAIQQRTQLSTTDIIQQAIDLMYKNGVKRKGKKPRATG